LIIIFFRCILFWSIKWWIIWCIWWSLWWWLLRSSIIILLCLWCCSALFIKVTIIITIFLWQASIVTTAKFTIHCSTLIINCGLCIGSSIINYYYWLVWWIIVNSINIIGWSIWDGINGIWICICWWFVCVISSICWWLVCVGSISWWLICICSFWCGICWLRCFVRWARITWPTSGCSIWALQIKSIIDSIHLLLDIWIWSLYIRLINTNFWVWVLIRVQLISLVWVAVLWCIKLNGRGIFASLILSFLK